MLVREGIGGRSDFSLSLIELFSAFAVLMVDDGERVDKERQRIDDRPGPPPRAGRQ